MIAPAVGVPPPRLRQADFVLLSLYWVAIGYLWQGLGTVIVPGIVQQLVGNQHKGTALSVLEGVGTLMAVVWQPVAGAVSDRTATRWGRRRPFIVAGTLGDVLFLAGIALSGSYLPVLVFYFLLQAASNTAQGPYQGLLPDVVPHEQRGTASGYYGLANLVGILAGSVGAGLVQANFGRSWAVASIAAILLVTMAITVLTVPDTAQPSSGQFQSPVEAVVATFTAPLPHRDFMWLMGSRLLVLMGIVGIQSFTYFFFSEVFFHGDQHQTSTATAKLLGVVLLFGIIITWPSAAVSDRIGRRSVLMLGGLIGSAGTAALVFSSTRWMPPAILAPLAGLLQLPELAVQTMLVGLLIGLGFGSFLSVDWAFLTDVVPRGQAGLFMGFSNIATAGSGIIARFIGGLLLDIFNSGPRLLGLPGGYPVIFGLFAAWMVAGSLLILKVKQPRE